MVDGYDAGKDITVDFRAISNEIHVNRRSAQWVLCQDASTNHWRFVPHSLGAVGGDSPGLSYLLVHSWSD
jgi:hypothetical protein